MGLERKDVRTYLDADVHRALTAICDQDGVSVADFVESVLVPVIMRRCHDAISLERKLREAGITRMLSDSGPA